EPGTCPYSDEKKLVVQHRDLRFEITGVGADAGQHNGMRISLCKLYIIFNSDRGIGAGRFRGDGSSVGIYRRELVVHAALEVVVITAGRNLVGVDVEINRPYVCAHMEEANVGLGGADIREGL